MCVGVEVIGLQDAVSLAMGASGEDEGVGALHGHSPSQQPQSPGKGSVAQRGNFDSITPGHHEDGGKQRGGDNQEPHF